MEFRSLHTVETAENVPLNVELAGVAGRVFAFAVDAVVMLLLMGLVLVFFALPSFFRSAPEIGKTFIPISLFLLFFGYHLFQEWLWNGKTLGKSLFGIRVVRNDGQPIGFWEAFGRNLLRVVDVYLSGIGLVCMLINRQEKRFGDYLAGTIVVSDQSMTRQGFAAAPAESPAGLPDEASRLTPEETALLGAVLARQKAWLPEARHTMLALLGGYFSERCHRPVESQADLEALLPGREG